MGMRFFVTAYVSIPDKLQYSVVIFGTSFNYRSSCWFTLKNS